MPGARCSADGRGAQRADATGSEPTLPARHGQNDPEAALTRKNALFAGHEVGAENWALLASLVATCKLNAVDPVAYLAATLEAILDGHPMSRIDDLMPWRFGEPSSHPA